jgi:hypothetical protein
LTIEFSVGRPTKVVWVGGLGPVGAVTVENIEDKMRLGLGLGLESVLGLRFSTLKMI